METAEYHKRIVEYYTATENAYRDSWDLENSLAIHYGYRDEKARSFPQSLLRMNEIMRERVKITKSDRVLDAGCGVGGSSIFLASGTGCRVSGITISERQMQQAIVNAGKKNVSGLVGFHVMDYCHTSFPDGSFDVVWGCESICYADDKEKFVREAFRLLKPGGRLIVADGFVTKFEDNDHPTIRQWLDGWQVNYLEAPGRFSGFMDNTGFRNVVYTDISKHTFQSSKRLLRFYYLASLYVLWKKLVFSGRPTAMQIKNIRACKSQYLGLKKGLWQYGLISGVKSRELVVRSRE